MTARTGEGQRRRSRKEPLEVRLSLRVTFGDGPGEAVQMLDDQRVPLVGSVFENRDRILRAFSMQMLRAGVRQPMVIKEIFPAYRLLARLKPSVF